MKKNEKNQDITEIKKIYEIRRNHLKKLIDYKFKTVVECAIKAKYHESTIWTLLNGTRDFTDLSAKRLEFKLSLPEGYLSSKDEHQYNIIDFIDVGFYEDVKNIINPLLEKIVKIPTLICEQFKIQNPESLIAIKMNDELMYPTINNNELIIIDNSQTSIEENKIYLFEINGLYKIRRPVIAGKDMVALHIDNENERKKYIINNIQLSDVKIIGKIVGGIKNYN